MISLKKIIIFVILFLPLISSCDKTIDENLDGLCNCTSASNCECAGMYQTITYDKAQNLMANHLVHIIDVRTTQEYESEHIEGAISLPLDEIENIKYAKNSNIIVYCKSGTRSKNAANKLLDLGYVNVYDLGSMENWKK